MKNANAQALGKLGGLARAKKLSKAKRKEITKLGGLARQKTRGTGITTRAIESAPKQAVYVWVNTRLDYPKDLAAKLGRRDLEIVSPGWLTSDQWRGRNLSAVMLDHATELSDHQWSELIQIRRYLEAKLGGLARQKKEKT